MKLFLVTFERVDPLFVIDVKDAKNPKVLWELKIPWYSTYLHPYDENHLIWLGYDTKENKYWWIQNNWIKLDLYQINYDKKCWDKNLTKEEFKNKIANDEFYEYAKVHGNYYGTLKKTVEDNLEKGLNVILEIDVQGALIAKEKKKDAILVFFRTKDMEILEKRLRDRKTDSEEVIQTRLKNAEAELEYENKYNYTIINESLEDSIQELIDIINK